jgi:hypothetical protein
MGWTTGVWFLVGAMMGFFSLCHHIQTGSGAHLTFYPVGTRGPYPPEVEWLGHEAEHSLPFRPRLGMHGAVPPFLLYVFMAWCLIKQDTSSWHGT